MKFGSLLGLGFGVLELLIEFKNPRFVDVTIDSLLLLSSFCMRFYIDEIFSSSYLFAKGTCI